MEEEVALAFMEHFQLTSEEKYALIGATRDAPLTSQFFQVLEKTQKIRTNTKYLLQVSSFTLSVVFVFSVGYIL